ncbi:MAG TPA: SMP-30/gluconolactonase/LRE family protein [Patescibacteria group bacterium]|nr:SMP-30/gluconolactonase/LRE family protein [Patescibacteria group bacterium]
MTAPRPLVDGLTMPESPRWHDGRLWLSDMGAREVVAVDLDGRSEVVARVPTGLTGIAFLPDGRLVLDTTIDGALLRLEPDGSLAPYADLTGLADPPWSDLIVDGRGNAYVGNLGFDFLAGAPPAPGFLALVTPDGNARRVADDLAFPNGVAVTPDNATLIVAESYAARLTAFTIGADGSLADRRVWADLPGAYPDGICIDAEGAVWFAEVPGRRCVRVREGGEVLASIELDRGCFACTLGGPDGRTLFLAAADWSGVSGMGDDARTGQVLTIEAPAAGAGWP